MKVSECTLYISGPITNCPDHERLFAQTELTADASIQAPVFPIEKWFELAHSGAPVCEWDEPDAS